jgi:hypothetical protein
MATLALIPTLVARPTADNVRRVDWRFLLPDPELRCVAFVGPSTSELLTALRAIGVGVDHIAAKDASDGLAGSQAAFDGCVLKSLHTDDVAVATRLVRPGGWLYWEVDRAQLVRGPWRGLGEHMRQLRVASANGARRELHRLGMIDIATWWHYPAFHECRWMVPLDGRAGIRHVLRGTPPLLRRIFERCGPRVVAAGVFPTLGTAISLVARRPPIGRPASS